MLRTLSLIALMLGAGSAFAQQEPETGAVLDFAPGAAGDIPISIPQTLRDARELGREWEESLDIQGPDSLGRDYDFAAFRDRALANPRVRALFGAEGAPQQSAPPENRYGSQRAFLMVSFSMPAPSLRSVMEEASALGVPVVFRGFVNNSVFDTRAALAEVFGDEAAHLGFGIDPTLFTRFDVSAVPTLIVVQGDLEACETSGCAADIPPPHDKIAGNIPLRAALELIERSGGDAAAEARVLLARAGQGQ